jgi:phosphoenolpyruvate carboxylase
VVRAFSYFSHLANIAETSTTSAAPAPTRSPAPRPGRRQPGPRPAARLRCRHGQPELAAFFDTAHVVPVLTAHPTEVQRKSILNCQMVIARLLDERDRMQLTPEEQEANDEALRRAVLTLWQTRMLRTKAVGDGRGDQRPVLLRLHLPARAAAPLRQPRGPPRQPRPQLGRAGAANFMQVGSWIGGDRDGNPFVTAEILEKALATQAEKALTYYMDEVHHAGLPALRGPGPGERLRRPAAPRRSLARRLAPPQRRALPPRPHRRVCAPRRHLRAAPGHQPPRHAVAPPRPTPAPTRWPRLEVIHRSSPPTAWARWPAAACATCAGRCRCSASTWRPRPAPELRRT